MRPHRHARTRQPRALALLAVVGLVCGCGPPNDAPQQWVTRARPIGTWQGTGNMTVGDVMLASGRCRVSWEAHDERPGSPGTFRLTARSSVSGRPLEEIANQRGEGRGSVELGEEDRRTYDFTVESQGSRWTFTVEDLVAVRAGEAPQAPR